MRKRRDDVQPNAAGRLLTAVVVLATLLGLFVRPAGAQTADALCPHVTSIPLVDSADGELGPAAGVTTARGAGVRESLVGPVVVLEETGARAQVELPQPLFHTRWSIGEVDLVDRLRIDATLRAAATDIAGAPLTGPLRARDESAGPGLSVEGKFQLGATRRAGVVLPGPVDSVLFSNGGTTPLDVTLGSGCAAFHADTTSVRTPTWDAATERFIARYSVTFQNNLPSARALRRAGLTPEASSSRIEAFVPRLDVTAPGFGDAEILDLQLPSVLARTRNVDFDGVSDTSLLELPSRLVSNVPLTIEVEVAYTPDFDDPIWSEGVDAPAPTLVLAGTVDGVDVAANVGLIDGLRTDAEFDSPAPVLRLEHERLDEPVVRADGTIETADRFVVHNDGELGVDDLTLRWDLADQYGPDTRLLDRTVVPTAGCAEASNERFDGVSDTGLIDPQSFGVGGRCEVVVRSTILPGTAPMPDGTDYSTIVVAEGRSGIRAVSATATVAESISQASVFAIDAPDPEVRNLNDGRYQLVGEVRMDNAGDQTLTEVGARLAVTIVDVNGDVDTRRVSVERIHALGRNCEASDLPRQTSADFRIMPERIELAPGDSCVIEYTLGVRPGAELEGWTVSASAAAITPRGETLEALHATSTITFPEAPALDVQTEIGEPENLGDGSHRFEVRTEIRNSGDVPLVAVRVDDNVATQFGDRVVRQETTTDTCSWIDARRPLLPSAGPEGSCLVVHDVTVRPGALLVDWQVGASATGTSVSFDEVAAGDSSELFAFTEAPAIATSIEVVDVERNGDGSFGLLLEGSVENVGDVRLRRLGLALDLDATLAPHTWSVDWISARTLSLDPNYDGSTATQLLTTADRLDVAERRTWLIRLTIDAGSESGPFVFRAVARAVSEALAPVVATDTTAAQALPVVQVVEERLEPTNNGDGTWNLEHVVRVRNTGAADLTDLRVDTDFERVLRRVLVGEATVVNDCASAAVGPSESCSVTTTATIRPWDDLGPYEVSSFVRAFDAESVEARQLVPVTPVNAAARQLDSIRLVERPAVSAAVTRSEATNNGDGTYSLRYRVETRNEGDVPLYRVDVSDGVAEAFGSAIVSDRLAGDTCADVAFASPLAPGGTCLTEHDVVIRPGVELGPWDASFGVGANSPAGERVVATAGAEPVAFAESVAVDVSASLRVDRNNGDGTYNLLHVVEVENTSDVPLLAVEVTDGPAAAFGDTLIDRDTLLHSCAWVDADQPLAPGATCEVQSDLRVQPLDALGPWSVATEVAASSPSGEATAADVATSEVTLTEAPDITLATTVTSVENNGDGSFRIVVDLTVANEGDVRVDDLTLDLDLADAFGETEWGVDGLISRDFSVNDEFPQLETTQLLSDPTSLRIGNGGTLTLVLSLTPGSEVGPFTTDLLATGTTPAGFPVEATIEASVDLPAIGVEVIGQTTTNNRDGSYTVETTYRIANRGTTPLEFVRLVEDVVEIYGGARVRVDAVDATGVPPVDLEQRDRGFDLVEWGAALEVGATADVTSIVVVTPGNALGPFNPTARVSGLSPTETAVVDTVVAPEPVEFVEQPALRVEQRLLERPVWNQGGRFDVSFAIDVINDGDVELRNLQIRQDLLNALGWGSSIIVRDVRSDLLTPNRDFDGLGVAPADPNTATDASELDEEIDDVEDFGDTRLLAGWDTLAADSTATIILDLTIAPESRGIYNTRVVASALSPAGTGLGSSGDEIEATTLTRLTVQGELGVAKQVLGEPRVRADGSVDVTYEIYVENAGPFPLSEVAVHDQLSQAFGIGATFVTSRVRADADSPCVGLTSSSFDGGTIDPVLVSRVELRPGESCRLQYEAIVTPSKPFPGPFRSSAFAIGSDPFAGTVIDDSTDGTDPDPDGNQEPGDNDLATVVRVELPEPSVAVTMTTRSIEPAASAGWFDITYDIEVTNTGLIDLRSTRLVADLDEQWPVSFRVRSVDSDDLRTNATFNGGRDIRLLSTQNVLRAGATATVEMVVRTRRPRDNQLTTVVDFDAVSVVGDPIGTSSATASSPDGTIVEFPTDEATATSGAWWNTLTEEEQQMFMLGGATFTVILLAMVVSLRRRWLRFAARRAARKAEADAVVIDLRDDVIDLRDSPGHHHDQDEDGHPPRRRRIRPRKDEAAPRS